MAANNPGSPPQPAQPATIPPAPSPLAAGYYPFWDSYTLAERISAKYGEKMRAILIDPETLELNERGTMLVDTKGRRIAMEDRLADGETISFMVGIAGG